MRQPVLVFTRTPSILGVNNALEPLSYLMKVEFVDKTDEVMQEYQNHNVKEKWILFNDYTISIFTSKLSKFMKFSVAFSIYNL